MKSIRVLSPDLLLLAEIDNYESLIFTRSHYGIGSFEFRINANKSHVETLQKKNLILIGNDSKKVGIIQYREIGFDDSGKQSEQWVIKGSTLDVVMKQRIVVPPGSVAEDAVSGSGETVIKHYINNHLVNPVNPHRKVDNLTIGQNYERGTNVSVASRYDELDLLVESIATQTGVGYEVILDFTNDLWVFDCYTGADRTTEQDINPPIIFSTEFETLSNASFTDSDLEYKNALYVGGSGEGVERQVAELDAGETGINRFERFHEATDVETFEELLQAGERELLLLAEVISFEAEANTHNTPFEYEKDWFLGDTVTVKHTKWNVIIHPQITTVTEIYEPSGFKLNVTFGKARPTLITKIKSEIAKRNSKTIQ